MSKTAETFRLDLVGQRFNRLSVLGYSHKDKRGAIYWLCRCDCGMEKAIPAGGLRSGSSQSCGCLWKDRISTHGMTKTRTFKSWDSMKQRCLNPNDPSYDRYGALGILICDRWLESFENFLEDMGERPPGTSLDRYPDNKGYYEPGNCRWATPAEQQRNLKNSRTLTINGETRPLIDWVPDIGLTYSTLLRRVQDGWSVERILGTPPREKRTKGSSAKN